MEVECAEEAGQGRGWGDLGLMQMLMEIAMRNKVVGMKLMYEYEMEYVTTCRCTSTSNHTHLNTAYRPDITHLFNRLEQYDAMNQ